MDYEETVTELARIEAEMKRTSNVERYEELEEQFNSLKAYLETTFPKAVEVNVKNTIFGK